jgi:hypothetical protein
MRQPVYLGAFAACFTLLPTHLSAAPQALMCDRTQLSDIGFSTRSAAAGWFPEQLPFVIDGAAAQSIYGAGTVIPDGTRQRIDFTLDQSTVAMRFFPSQLRVSVWLVPPSGYIPTTPSRYQCRVVEGLAIRP